MRPRGYGAASRLKSVPCVVVSSSYYSLIANKATTATSFSGSTGLGM